MSIHNGKMLFRTVREPLTENTCHTYKKYLMQVTVIVAAMLIFCAWATLGRGHSDTLVPTTHITTYNNASDTVPGTNDSQVSEIIQDTTVVIVQDTTVSPVSDTTVAVTTSGSSGYTTSTAEYPADTTTALDTTKDTIWVTTTEDATTIEELPQNPVFSVGVICDREYSVSDGQSDERFTSENYGEYELGTVITIKAEDANQFGYWRDSNNTIVSESPEYSFIVCGDTVITAVFNTKATNKATVIFKSDYGQIVSRTQISVKNSASVQIPDVPRKYGYTSLGWQYSVEQISDLVKRALETPELAYDVIIIRPVYEVDNSYPSDSTSNDLTIIEKTSHEYTFLASFSVPEDCRIIKSGIIFTTDKLIGSSSDDFKLETAEQRTSSVISEKVQYVWTVHTYETLYVRTYLMYVDASGLVYEIYGSIKSNSTTTSGVAKTSVVGRIKPVNLLDKAVPMSISGYEEKR
ncbi:MAG: hypothetical protein ACI4TD_10245 [Phocaeicola sp.]